MMFQNFHKMLLQIRVKNSLIYFHQDLPYNPISHFSSSTNQSSSTVNYLTNSCGFSAASAINTAKKLSLKNPANADLVLAFLTNHGFTKTQIRELVTRSPRSLTIKVENNLQPKFQFLLDVGLSNSQIADLIAANPYILNYSLEYRLVPIVNFLKGHLHNNGHVIKALRNSTWLLSHDIQRNVVPNVSLLEKHGIPISHISRMLMSQTRRLTIKPERFTEIVTTVKGLGFDPRIPSSFMEAIVAVSMKQPLWDAKAMLYQSMGLSEVEVLSAFRKQPICMSLSEEKIRKGMVFLVNKLGLKPSDVVSYPHLLLYSLEKRIIPRCAVLHTLASKNLIKKDIKLCQFYGLIKIKDVQFLKRYGIEYQDEVTDLLNSNQGKIEFFELNIKA